MALDQYTTLVKIRLVAGFKDNTNVDDATRIEPNKKASEGEINSALSARYTLPLSGNPSYSGSPAEAILTEIATELGACFLLLEMYPGQTEDWKKMKYVRCASLRKRLKEIAGCDPCTPRLIGSDGEELTLLDSSGRGLTGYPNDENLNPAKFTMDDKF